MAEIKVERAPSGFCISEAIFARSLFGAMPTEQVRPVSSSILFIFLSDLGIDHAAPFLTGQRADAEDI